MKMDNNIKFQNITLGIIIDTVLKIPPYTGVTYRLYYLSKRLTQKGVRVKIFLCNRNFKNDEEIKNLLEETSIEFHIIKVNSVNILQAEDPTHILKYKEIARGLNIPFCLEMHDIEASLLELLKWNYKEINFRKALSIFACDLAEKIICMTPLDYDELIHKIGVDINKLILVPNPIDLKRFPYYGPNLKEKNIVFLGNMFYWPNRNAVKFIAKKIYPKIIKTNKKIKFTFIGMVPEGIKKTLSKNNFIFTDSIDNARLNKNMKEATIALCPVAEGSGMKVKILNYCAAGLPVITTKMGASGYEKIDSLIIEDDLNKYPDIINTLLNCPDKMKFLGEKNRMGIEKYYSLDKIANKIIGVYQNVLNNFCCKRIVAKKEKRVKIPLPLWLKEKRAGKIRNKNYYIIKNGKIISKKEL